MIQALTKNPARFNRFCAIAALAFLVASIGARYAISGSSRQDFSQYYMGGVMARLGAWDSIYPIPKPNTTLNVGYVDGSTMKPKYAEEAAKRGVGDEPRYIQPPPVALLFVPLSFFTYSQAHGVWIIVLIGCTWVICLQAARMFELCRGELAEPSIVGGIIMLLIACSPAAHRWIRVQNVSPIVGAMIGSAAVALVDARREMRGGLALWIGAILKYATIALMPVVFVLRRWKALAFFIGAMVASVAVTLAIAGRGPFEEYQNVVAPTLRRTSELPQNQAIMGLIARMTKSNPISAGWGVGVVVVRVVTFIALAMLLIANATHVRQHPSAIFAACCAFVCWMLMFSPMFWEHYVAYLAPFFGWLGWEATRSRIRLVTVMIAAMLAALPTPLFVTRVPDPFKAHLLLATMLIVAISISRLYEPSKTADGN